MTNPPIERHCWRALAAAAAFGLLPAGARADAGQVVNYSVGATLTRDDNLFRLSPAIDPLRAIGSRDKSDILSTTSVGVVAEKPFGIQRLKLDMQLNTTRYQQFRRLDNDSYHVSGTWAWALGHRLHGELSSSRRTALSGFDQIASTSRNINTNTTQGFSAYLLVTPDWELFGALGNNDSANSAADNQAASYASRSTDTGLRYNSPAGHQLSLLKRQVRSALVRQDNVDVNGTWLFSPMTRLSWGLGRVKRQAGNSASSDSTSATGNLAATWEISPKTQFNFAVRQDLAAAAGNFSTSTQVRSAVLGANWAATAKTTMQFSLDQSATRYANDPATIAAPREDHVRNVGLTLSYRPDRALSLSLSLRDEMRDSNQAAFTYRDRLATASAAFAF